MLKGTFQVYFQRAKKYQKSNLKKQLDFSNITFLSAFQIAYPIFVWFWSLKANHTERKRKYNTQNWARLESCWESWWSSSSFSSSFCSRQKVCFLSSYCLTLDDDGWTTKLASWEINSYFSYPPFLSFYLKLKMMKRKTKMLQSSDKPFCCCWKKNFPAPLPFF